jgi:hypothetical protein
MIGELRAVLVALSLAALCGPTLGCETTESNTEENMGSAFESTKAQMLAKQPDAFGADSEHRNMPGTDAQGVLDNYRENLKVENQQERRENVGLIDLRE